MYMNMRHVLTIALTASLAACVEFPLDADGPPMPESSGATDTTVVSPPCVCDAPHSAPLLYGPIVTLTSTEHTVRVQPGDTPTTIALPLAAQVPGQRWTVKVWGSDLNEVTFLPAVDPATGLMDNMVDVDGDALLQTSGGNPAITIEAYADTDGQDGPDQPGWIVIGR